MPPAAPRDTSQGHAAGAAGAAHVPHPEHTLASDARRLSPAGLLAHSLLTASAEMVGSFSEWEWGPLIVSPGLTWHQDLVEPQEGGVSGEALEGSVRNRSSWFKR